MIRHLEGTNNRTLCGRKRLPTSRMVMACPPQDATCSACRGRYGDAELLRMSVRDALAWLWSAYPRAGAARAELRNAIAALGDRPPEPDA